METTLHGFGDTKIAQVQADSIILSREQDALDLMVNPALQGARRIILPASCIAPEFFDLTTGLLGTILQKFVTYQMKLAVTGKFEHLSKNFKAFMAESNQGDQFFFVPDTASALEKLA